MEARHLQLKERRFPGLCRRQVVRLHSITHYDFLLSSLISFIQVPTHPSPERAQFQTAHLFNLQD